MNSHRAWMVKTLVVLWISLCTSASFADDQILTVRYCDLFSSPQKYDGEIIATQALMASGEHEVAVYDTSCMPTTTENRSAYIDLPDDWGSKLAKRLSKIFRHDRTARVGFEAIFHSSGGPYGMFGHRFRFEVRRLTSVEEVPRT